MTGDQTMFSMPFTTGTLSALNAASVGSGRSPDGLDQLLSAFGGEQLDFSAELHALLQQMDPQMLQRLESMLAGGMTLPQAARELLSERVSERQTGGVPQALRAGMIATRGVSESLDPLTMKATLDASGGREPPRVVLPAHLAAAVPAPLQATASSVASHPIAPLPGQSIALPPQVATSLLDMGVPQPLGGKDWQGAIAERIVWMTQGDQQFARLTLNPPHLGPLEVRVSLSQDQTSVHFLTGHAAVRDALEAAMPRLRELFDQQSMSLVHAEVSDPGAQRDRHTAFSAQGAAGGAVADDEDGTSQAGADAVTEPMLVRGRGLIDLFV